jgi:dipeptidyl aminopeptidase/acylaminoacyl peptidase
MTSPRPEQLLTVARAYRPTPSAGGSLYFASDMAGLSQTYRLDGADRFPIRLAPSQDRTFPVADTPLGLLVRQDQGGNETWQLALVGPDGILRQVTRDRKAIHRDVRLTPDRRKAGISYNPGGQDDWVLAVIDLETGNIEHWLDGGGNWSWLGWSPDGTTAVVARASHSHRNNAYLVVPGAEPRPLLSGALLVSGVAWTNERLLGLTDLNRQYIGLVEVDPDQPDTIRRRLIDEEHDVLTVVPDPSGHRAAVIVNEGACDALRILDLETGAEAWRASLPPGTVYVDNASDTSDHVAWSFDGRRLFVAWESPTTPAEIYELPSGTRWTRAGGDSVPGLVAPTDVSYGSFDGLEIPCLHYRGDTAPKPTVVLFHGGPEGQSRGNFNPQIAMWNAAGFDVLAPNVRGSTGYGRRFYSLDDKRLRWDSVRDGVEAGRWLRREGLATHLVAMGGSYGGFMTLAVLVEDPELWDAAIDVVGVTDFHSFFKNTSGWRRAIRAAEYGDPDSPDSEFLAEFSPLRRAHRIKAPLLIIHGRNDVRVPVSEAYQIHEAASDSELLVFDDEGHGITKHGNRARAYGRALEFARERLSD